MGTTISSVFNRLFGKKEMRILMVGLEDAGKTTILYTLKLGEIVHAVPTVHINVETLDYKNISLTIWDCSGRPRIRPLLRHYYQNTQGIIFVVDSSDTENIDEVKYLVTNMLLEDELKDAAILVFANKQDMPNAISVDELTKALELNNLRNRRCYVQASCAIQGEGLYEGLDWLSNELAMK